MNSGSMIWTGSGTPNETKTKYIYQEAGKVDSCNLSFCFAFILFAGFLGRTEIAENLSMTVVTAIIGTVITYCIKSFKETKEEEKLRLERETNNAKQEEVWTNKEV